MKRRNRKHGRPLKQTYGIATVEVFGVTFVCNRLIAQSIKQWEQWKKDEELYRKILNKQEEPCKSE